MQDRLYEDPDLARFYDAENGWRDDMRYCLVFAGEAQSVLDLGCGTGRLAAALGGTREVWGVDPAPAMLEVARSRPAGSAVTFVQGDGRTIRLGRRFDLVLLTGHAFQCFLTDADQRALCETIAAHLTRNGRFIFDSRNPAVEEWREWVPELTRRDFEHHQLGRVTAWNDASNDPTTQIVTYETCYKDASGNMQTASSRIRFATRDDIAARLAEGGLRVDKWLGDWTGQAFTDASPEIIPVGRLA